MSLLRLTLLALLVLSFAAAAGRAAPPPPAEGHVVGATVAVSGVTGPAAAESGAHAAATGSPNDGATARAAAASGVTIRDFSFGPRAITVHVGDTVTWTNAGPTAHTATADGGGFDTGTLKAGQRGSHTFTTAGTFAYHCSLHPFMRGSVEVVAAASGGGSAAPS
ncbi:MAG: cupredoxin domain-containing protein, partial [Conexibacter sp.]